MSTEKDDSNVGIHNRRKSSVDEYDNELVELIQKCEKMSQETHVLCIDDDNDGKKTNEEEKQKRSTLSVNDTLKLWNDLHRLEMKAVDLQDRLCDERIFLSTSIPNSRHPEYIQLFHTTIATGSTKHPVARSELVKFTRDLMRMESDNIHVYQQHVKDDEGKVVTTKLVNARINNRYENSVLVSMIKEQYLKMNRTVYSLESHLKKLHLIFSQYGSEIRRFNVDDKHIPYAQPSTHTNNLYS